MIRFRPSLIVMSNVLVFMFEILAKNFLSSISKPFFSFVMSSFVGVGSVRTW